jgi:hypothetical protein
MFLSSSKKVTNMVIIIYTLKTLCYKYFSDFLVFPFSSSKYQFKNVTVKQPQSTCGLSIALQQLSGVLMLDKCLCGLSVAVQQLSSVLMLDKSLCVLRVALQKLSGLLISDKCLCGLSVALQVLTGA